MKRIAAVVILVLAVPARASDLVLYQGTDPAGAVAQVAREAKVDASTLQPTTLTALLQGRPPVLQDGGSVEVCARAPATEDDVKKSMGDAESAMAYLEYDKALAALDEAAKLLGCLSTPADTAVAGRLYYLRGLVHYFSKEEMAARGAWTQAHRFDPDLAWDDNFPPDGKPLFAEACKQADQQEAAVLSLVPPIGADALWIDGRPPVMVGDHVSLPPGEHLVQYGTAEQVTTARIALDEGAQPTLVVPQAVTDHDLIWVSEHKEDLLAEVLGATLDKDATVYVVWGDRTYSGTVGSPELTLLDHVPPPENEPLPPAPEPPPKHHSRVLAITGFSVAGVAALTSGLAWKPAMAIILDVPNTTSMGEYDALKREYKRNRIAYNVANGFVVLGTAVGAVGIYVPLADGVRLAPAPGGIRLEVRR